MEDMLIVVSGLPRAGKSTIADQLARDLNAPVLSVDPIEAAMLRCRIRRSLQTGVAAYEVAASLAEHQLGLGLSVITDSVSSIEAARAMWRRCATRARTELRVIEVLCSDEDVHRERLAGRRRALEGFAEPSWDDVQRRRVEWEPWIDDCLVVDTMRPMSQNVAEAIDFVRR